MLNFRLGELFYRRKTLLKYYLSKLNIEKGTKKYIIEKAAPPRVIYSRLLQDLYINNNFTYRGPRKKYLEFLFYSL